MFGQTPNGYFLNDLIVFNSLREGRYVSKGFIFEAPDLTNGQAAELNGFQDQLSLMLASLSEQQRQQIQFFSDSDYRQELLRYQEETKKATNVWTRRSRNQRFERYWEMMTERKLRRQRLVFYVSRRIENSPRGIQSKSAPTEYYEQLLSQLRAEFDHIHEMLAGIFASQGARIIPMKDADHYRHYTTFLNPSLADRFDYDPIGGFDPQLSIQDSYLPPVIPPEMNPPRPPEIWQYSPMDKTEYAEAMNRHDSDPAHNPFPLPVPHQEQ